MVRVLRLLLCLSLLSGMTACASGGRTAPAPVTLRVAGSTSMEPMLVALGRAYQFTRPNVLVDLSGSDSAMGLDAFGKGLADLAAVSWRQEEKQPPQGTRAVPVARDAIAVVVHPANLVSNLTLLQLRALYRGEVADWAALGGAAGEPIVVSREEGSGTRLAFEAMALAGDRVTLNALVMPSSQRVVDYVGTHKMAIGYASTALLDSRVHAVPVEDVAPTPDNLKIGAYVLTRTLYLIAPQPAPEEVQAFIDFTLSPAGQAVVAQYYMPLR